MARRRRQGFFSQDERTADDLARQREVEALITPRRIMVQDVPVERIFPNPFQARRTFDGIDELAQSIRALGFATRLRIRPDPTQPGYFQLVFGERRLRAAKEAELAEVPCEIAEHTDDELIEIGLAENIQRRDLDPLEEAHAFQTLIEQRGYTIRKLAERLGKNKGYIEGRLVLLRVPADVQHMVEQRPDTIRAAREIAKLQTPEERQPLIEGVVDGTLSKEDVRSIVRESMQPADQTAPEDMPSPAAPNTTPDTESPSPRPSPQPARAKRTTQTTPQILERDFRTLQTILARWNGLITDQDQHGLIRHYVDQVLREVTVLTNALHDAKHQQDREE
jgi:ParB family chromosome partitioning protein